MNDFDRRLAECCGHELRSDRIATIQVNLGLLCSQRCRHCHLDASPERTESMSWDTMARILAVTGELGGVRFDLTGGAPELNPNFEYFVTSARPLVGEIIVRSNLSVLFEKSKEHLPRFFKDNHIHLICSLPCYTKDNVDSQRGNGVYEKSIKALKLLNQLGYSREENLNIDLVYNPSGASLPPQQKELEQDYKRELDNEYGIHFNRLITITNVPIKRFKDYLQDRGELESYMGLLKQSFNSCVLQNIMCRTFISVEIGRASCRERV